MPDKKIQLFCTWCGLAYVVLLFIGWWPLAGFYPLHKPSAGEAEIAQIFADNHIRIRIGMVAMMWGSACCIPFGGLIAHHIAKIEGASRILTYTFVMAVFANAMFTFYPCMWWVIASFRAEERAADLIYMLNDAAWIQFLGALTLVMPMYICIALSAFRDTSPNPVFPRWVGYFNIWIFVLLIPSQLLFFFYEGPFAWNGVIAIWIPLTAFSIWFFVMFDSLRKAALRPVAA